MRIFLISLSAISILVFVETSSASIFSRIGQLLKGEPEVVSTATREIDKKTAQEEAALEAVRKSRANQLTESNSKISEVEKDTARGEKSLAGVNKNLAKDTDYLLKNGGRDSDGKLFLDTSKIVRPEIVRSAQRLENNKELVEEIDRANLANKKKLADLKAEQDAAEAVFRAEEEKRLAGLTTLSRQRTLAFVSDAVDTLDNKIRFSNAFANITSLQGGTLSAAEKLFRLEKVVDESLTGTYMREKMTKLLTSDVFCKAQNACAAGKKPLTNAELGDDLDKVFYENGRKLLEAPPKSGTGTNTRSSNSTQ